MGFYAKKTITGYKQVSGRSDPEAEYYICPVSEVEKLEKQYAHAGDVIERLKAELQKRVHAAYDDARAQVDEIKNTLATQNEKDKEESARLISEKEAEITDLKSQLDTAKTDLQTEKDLQKNLLRICRERSNQQRNLKPKKSHDGYIVLESSQYTEHYKSDTWASGIDPARYTTPDQRRYAQQQGMLRVTQHETTTWRSILQTPYDATIPLADIETRIEDDLWTGANVLADLGCPRFIAHKDNGPYYKFVDDNSAEINGCYKWKYKANYRAGLWELEIYTTLPLIVPEHRRPENGKAKGKTAGKGREEPERKQEKEKEKEQEQKVQAEQQGKFGFFSG